LRQSRRPLRLPTTGPMKLTDPKPLAVRILAVLLCVAVVVFLSALLNHHHDLGTDADHAAHCQVCALAHTAPTVAAAVDLIVLMQMLLLTRFSAPSRGSPSFAALPTTRPPPVLR
jgi:hypothetical protein